MTRRLRKPQAQRPKRGGRSRPAYLDDDDVLADDLYAHRNDPDAVSEEAVEIASRPSGMEVVSFRLPSAELDLVESAAFRAGESISQYVRNALAMRLGYKMVAVPIEWAFGGGSIALNIPSGARFGRTRTFGGGPRELVQVGAPTSRATSPAPPS